MLWWHLNVTLSHGTGSAYKIKQIIKPCIQIVWTLLIEVKLLEATDRVETSLWAFFRQKYNERSCVKSLCKMYQHIAWKCFLCIIAVQSRSAAIQFTNTLRRNHETASRKQRRHWLLYRWKVNKAWVSNLYYRPIW